MNKTKFEYGTEIENKPFSQQLRHSLHSLELAYDLAKDAECNPWDLAVEIGKLYDSGISNTELRWMLCKGLALAADDITEKGQTGRKFGPLGSLRLGSRTCFILTEKGQEFAQEMKSACTEVDLTQLPVCSPQSPKPSWDSDKRLLTVEQHVIKQFRVPAENQELILNTFHEDGWVGRIDDPLPHTLNLDPKRRLQSAIMCLNRNQKNNLLKFRGDGNGTGITWELIRPCGS